MKAQVLLPKIFNFSFTYETKKEKLTPGDIVEVPFGKEKAIGVVWSDKSFAPKDIKIGAITAASTNDLTLYIINTDNRIIKTCLRLILFFNTITSKT